MGRHGSYICGIESRDRNTIDKDTRDRETIVRDIRDKSIRDRNTLDRDTRDRNSLEILEIEILEIEILEIEILEKEIDYTRDSNKTTKNERRGRKKEREEERKRGRKKERKKERKRGRLFESIFPNCQLTDSVKRIKWMEHATTWLRSYFRHLNIVNFRLLTETKTVRDSCFLNNLCFKCYQFLVFHYYLQCIQFCRYLMFYGTGITGFVLWLF